jgi:uncharacterized damage-inducible protein DinB
MFTTLESLICSINFILKMRTGLSIYSRGGMIFWIAIIMFSLSAIESSAQQKNANNQNPSAVTPLPAGTGNMLTTQERDSATQFLKQTQLEVFAAVKNLSKAQLTFKPAADKWSVEDCVKHIAASETTLWAMVEMSMKQPVDPQKQTETKLSDEGLISAVKDRSHKSKTFAALEPANTSYKTLAEALTSFKENREKLIAYVRDTEEDLRSHVSVLPFGTCDAYQLILLISAHSDRHMQQIEEVKSNANFPKS